MADDYSFLGFDDGWFANSFEQFHLFGYVGDRERLLESIRTKSFVRQLLEIFAPRINIATIVNALTQYPLLKVDPDKTVAREIINIVTSQENNRTLTQLLNVTHKRGRKNGTYFERVGANAYRKTAVFAAPFGSIQDRLITVEGQLVHRTAIRVPSVAAQLRASSAQWVLADVPPHAFVSANTRFNGKILLLREDEGFSNTFAQYLPFSPDIAWYPYVRITGFFDASKLQTELLPSLSVSLVEYRRPRGVPDVSNAIVQFATGELESRNWLGEQSNLVLFGYLFPLVFKVSNLRPEEADPDVAVVLRRYRQVVGNGLPIALMPFYDALPQGDIA